MPQDPDHLIQTKCLKRLGSLAPCASTRLVDSHPISHLQVCGVALTKDEDIDMRATRLDHLFERRAELLNSVLLRQNPHNVHEWINRVKLFEKVYAIAPTLSPLAPQPYLSLRLNPSTALRCVPGHPQAGVLAVLPLNAPSLWAFCGRDCPPLRCNLKDVSQFLPSQGFCPLVPGGQKTQRAPLPSTDASPSKGRTPHA